MSLMTIQDKVARYLTRAKGDEDCKPDIQHDAAEQS